MAFMHLYIYTYIHVFILKQDTDTEEEQINDDMAILEVMKAVEERIQYKTKKEANLITLLNVSVEALPKRRCYLIRKMHITFSKSLFRQQFCILLT